MTKPREQQTAKPARRRKKRIDPSAPVRSKKSLEPERMTEISHSDPMQEFANRIVAELENGVKPWVRPWDPEKAGGPQAPFNPVTGKRYHGINVLILGMDMRAFQSGDPRWMTYQQAQEKKWQVRKGEKSTTIFFTKPYEVKDGDAEDGRKMIRVLKHYAVFHATQIDGVPTYKAPNVEEAPWTRPESADIILKNSGAVVRIGGDKAFYSPTTDHIQLPPENAFRGPPEFAATALHELAHWTGHPSRLNRDMQSRFGSAAYAMEELRAELASAFVASELGIPTDIPQHASYIADWIKPLKADKREIFRAAADAQKIADMQLGFHPAYAAQMQAKPTPPTPPAREVQYPSPMPN
jgi:antirestriction protein ArdC